MTVSNHIDLLGRIVVSTKLRRLYVYPLHHYRSDKQVAPKVTKSQLHGLLLELGIIKKTPKKVVFKLEKLKQVLHLLEDTKMYAANFVGDYDNIEKTKQRSWYIDIIPIGRIQSISWTASDSSVLKNLKFEYLKNIDDDVDRRRRELQEEERRQMVSKKNEGRQEREEQQLDQQPQPETDKEVEHYKKSMNVPKNYSLVTNYRLKNWKEQEENLKNKFIP